MQFVSCDHQRCRHEFYSVGTRSEGVPYIKSWWRASECSYLHAEMAGMFSFSTNTIVTFLGCFVIYQV